jgi:hypothetical protein
MMLYYICWILAAPLLFLFLRVVQPVDCAADLPEGNHRRAQAGSIFWPAHRRGADRELPAFHRELAWLLGRVRRLSFSVRRRHLKPMGRSGIYILMIYCCMWAGTTAYSMQSRQPRPPRHYEDYGACPFECCTYRQWTVNSDTVFYKDRSTSSAILFRAKKGEHVIGLTGVVITLKPGKAVVKKATTLGTGRHKVRVTPGNILYLLHYEGEGVYKFWFRGGIYEDEMPSSPDDNSSQYIQMLNEPQTVWWVQVKNRRGRVGWSKQDDHFDDMDACG